MNLTLVLVVSFACIVCVENFSHARKRKILKDLKFGFSTAAYQIEGAWNVSDKSESIWDRWVHQVPSPINDKNTGDITADSYHQYKRDVQMLRFLRASFYRFSISWPRVLPTGFSNYISGDGIAYYNRLIDELIKYNIEPIATIYHWDLPQSLQDLGGWTNIYIADWFLAYSQILFANFGDRVKTWITINEPMQICEFGYGQKRYALALGSSGIADYLCTKNILIAHARVWHLYDEKFRDIQKGICGIVISMEWNAAATNKTEDVVLADLAMDFNTGMFAHPIFTTEGGFPRRVIEKIANKSASTGWRRSRLPELTEDEITYIRGTSDFFGFNHYSTVYYSSEISKVGQAETLQPFFYKDLGAVFKESDDPGVQIGANGMRVIPWGFRKALRYVKDHYNNPQILVTECGFSTLGGLNDLDRVSFHRKYLEQLLDAVELDGCRVMSYGVWSLMDNFEWNCGLRYRFGVFEVDFESDNKTRSSRASACLFRQIAASRTLDFAYDPVCPRLVV